MLKKSFATIIVSLLIVVSFPTIVSDDPVYNNVNISSNIFIRKGFQLRCLERSLQYIEDSNVKTLIQNIIQIVNRKGYATSNDIRMIIKNNVLDDFSIYYLARVKTIGKSDGYLWLFPGTLRSYIMPFYAKGAIFCYFTLDWYPRHGWNLTVNNELLSEDDGYIIGFFGYIRRWRNDPELDAACFKLNGVALLVIHIHY